MMNWLREHYLVVSAAVVILLLEVLKRVQSYRAKKAFDARVGLVGFPEFKPRVVTYVECECGMGSSCEDAGAIVVAGWVAPTYSPIDRSLITGWRCPKCVWTPSSPAGG